MRKLLWSLFLVSSQLAIHLLLLSSCAEKKKYYTNLEIVNMATTADAGFKLVLPDREHPPVSCVDYGKGCMYGLTAEMRGLSLIMVHFQSEEEAFEGAKKVNALYFHDWVFDDIRDEPLLEGFFVKVYGAKRAIPPTPVPTPVKEKD